LFRLVSQFRASARAGHKHQTELPCFVLQRICEGRCDW